MTVSQVQGSPAWPAVVPELPREVVQHIFSVQSTPGSNPAFSLKDRVRARAVCRAWNAYLDSKAWPIEALLLNGGDEADLRIASWVQSTQPALHSLQVMYFGLPSLLPALSSISAKTALTVLWLLGESEVLQGCLAAVCLFPRLEILRLEVRELDDEAQLDLAALQPLLALQRLECNSWGSVKATAPTLLPQLTSLELVIVGSVEIDAALPSLQFLEVGIAATLRLAGERLQLPQLSQLCLQDVDAATIHWPAMPHLADLRAAHSHRRLDIGANGIPALSSLTSLTLGYGPDQQLWASVDAALQTAPPSMQHLQLGSFRTDWSQPPPFHCLPQLTSLVSTGPGIIPHLGPLTRLRHLKLNKCLASDLSQEQVGCFRGLTSLRHLSLVEERYAVTATSPVLAAIQVLLEALPPGCALEHPCHTEEP